MMRMLRVGMDCRDFLYIGDESLLWWYLFDLVEYFVLCAVYIFTIYRLLSKADKTVYFPVN